jgi:hypothetical protein
MGAAHAAWRLKRNENAFWKAQKDAPQPELRGIKSLD